MLLFPALNYRHLAWCAVQSYCKNNIFSLKLQPLNHVKILIKNFICTYLLKVLFIINWEIIEYIYRIEGKVGPVCIINLVKIKSIYAIIATIFLCNECNKTTFFYIPKYKMYYCIYFSYNILWWIVLVAKF